MTKTVFFFLLSNKPKQNELFKKLSSISNFDICSNRGFFPPKDISSFDALLLCSHNKTGHRGHATVPLLKSPNSRCIALCGGASQKATEFIHLSPFIYIYFLHFYNLWRLTGNVYANLRVPKYRGAHSISQAQFCFVSTKHWGRTDTRWLARD